tara:strand:+ start:5937 stop:6206 length:270 start_codon:yes stop_codon:yes gene_type:complete
MSEYYITDITGFWGANEGEVNLEMIGSCGEDITISIPAYVMFENLSYIVDCTMRAKDAQDKCTYNRLRLGAKSLKSWLPNAKPGRKPKK